MPTISVGAYPSWLPPVAFRIKADFRRIPPPELNSYPATPSASVSHGDPDLVPEFLTRYQRRRHQVTLELAPVFPQIPTVEAEDYPAWLEPPAFQVRFDLARVPLPEPAGGTPRDIDPYPGWATPPALRFEFDRQHIAIEIVPLFPSPPGRTAESFPAWLEPAALRRDFDIKPLSTGLIAFPEPVLPTSQAYPAWLELQALSRDFDIRAIRLDHIGYPPKPPTPPSAQAFPAWLEPAAMRRAFDIHALELTLAQFPPTPPLLIFPKGSIIEQSFLVRAIEQNPQVRKIEAEN